MMWTALRWLKGPLTSSEQQHVVDHEFGPVTSNLIRPSQNSNQQVITNVLALLMRAAPRRAYTDATCQYLFRTAARN